MKGLRIVLSLPVAEGRTAKPPPQPRAQQARCSAKIGFGNAQQHGVALQPVDRTARIDCLAILSDDEVPNALRLRYRTDLEQCLAVGVSETICAETEPGTPWHAWRPQQ